MAGALLVSDDFNNEVFTSYNPNPIQSCGNCRKIPVLILRILNPQTGGTVRMFKCDCGEQTWSEEKQ
jgi:hypothetical protein